MAALVGNLATNNELRARCAQRRARASDTTGTLCHLEASIVHQALDSWDLASLDILFIENVGDLIYPAATTSAIPTRRASLRDGR